MRREHRVSLRHGHARAKLPLMITPMIDVVFLLLVYFFLTVDFGAQELSLRTEAPLEQTSTSAADPFALEIEPLVIHVARAVDGPALSLSAGLRAPSNSAELEQLLRDSQLNSQQPHGLFPADHPIRLAPARDARWEDVVSVFNAVMNAGYRTVAFGGGE